MLQTPEGARLAEASTRAGGASADWHPAQLAATSRLATLLEDFGKGGDERNRVVQYARRRLAPQLQSGQMHAASAAASLAAALEALGLE